MLFIVLFLTSLPSPHIYICTDQADFLYLPAPARYLTKACSCVQRGLGQHGDGSPREVELNPLLSWEPTLSNIDLLKRTSWAQLYGTHLLLASPPPPWWCIWSRNTSKRWMPLTAHLLPLLLLHNSSIKLNLPSPRPGVPWVERSFEEKGFSIPNTDYLI